ncbi:translation initiation factor IF-2-like isoform X2 [Dermacentor silvarum]|uniref:translation initiation factor IF-2-like isoform X2 n=1 Tax=Dermacentor silvarum TaxID=543639 RepID=UPI002101C341|nr:translation initiation factor IF-2-like isoform X2 [Dermacentor silvarum]
MSAADSDSVNTSVSAAEKRAQAATTKRQRRQADPKLRAREAERKRQRRREAATDATRARAAEAARQRRQADPELRAREAERRRKHRQEATDATKAREAESKRKRRAADLEATRKREAESQRKRRAADLEAARKREAESQRKRRAADPEAARQREAESKRKRRAADPEAARQREAESKRKRRAADPEAARQRESAAKAASRLKQLLRLGKDGADARLKRDFLDRSFGHSCSVCDRLWFDKNLTKIGSIQNEQYRNAAIGVLQQEFGNITAADGSNVISNYAEYTVCATCKDALTSGRVPVMSVTHFVVPDREKEPASCCTHEILAKPVQTEASWLFNSSVVDVAVETSRSADVCKSTQTSLVVVKVHRWTETTDLIESQEGDTDAQESPAPHVCGMPMLTNMDQSPGVAALYSHQVDVCDDTFMDCSGGPAAAQTLYDGSCIVRWCTNTSPGRLFRVPKDNRMEAFLKYAERPHLLGLSKEIVHHYRICSAHFTESDYMDPAKTKLKWLAVPSIKAPEESKGDTASPGHLREPSPQPGPSGL